MVIVCLTCRQAIRVMGDPTEGQFLIGDKSEFWPDRYPCFNCSGKARGYHEPELEPEVIHSLQFHNLSPIEAFMAFEGLGIPEEQNCVEEVVHGLLTGHAVKKVEGRQHPYQTRFYIDSIEFDNGVVMYLSASPQGACVYRVRKPFKGYAEKVLQDGQADHD